MKPKERCPRCGTLLAGAGVVEDLCSHCLMSLALEDQPAEAGTLPVAVLGPAWSAELRRRAARRLELAAAGLGLAFLGALILSSLIKASGWFDFAHLQLKIAVGLAMVGISAGVSRAARSESLDPRGLLRLSLAYEVIVALGISLSDHLDALSLDTPLAAISWLCVWIALFPLIVPAPPRWALAASLAAASTWPLAYAVGVTLLGNPRAPLPIELMNFSEAYIAAGLALLATELIRRLQQLGSYHMERRIDQGGMGEVWRARHSLLKRPVAIKLLRPDRLGAGSPERKRELLARFEREAQATAGLQSVHTIALHDFGVTPDGAFYYAMELLDGLDLERLVARHGAMPPERAVHLLVQACDSLAEAHAAGLIHRDVKPANIVACRLGLQWDFVKLLDFGLVGAIRPPHADTRLTSDGVILGTPAYLPPEAFESGFLDERADLYGLGCVGYWLLTGSRVFEGPTLVDLAYQHSRSVPTPPSERLGRELPGELEELILACLAKAPGERPASAEWLAERLRGCPLREPWTAQRARDWWRDREPGPGGEDAV